MQLGLGSGSLMQRFPVTVTALNTTFPIQCVPMVGACPMPWGLPRQLP